VATEPSRAVVAAYLGLATALLVASLFAPTPWASLLRGSALLLAALGVIPVAWQRATDRFR
jgi:hypothetical protein